MEGVSRTGGMRLLWALVFKEARAVVGCYKGVYCRSTSVSKTRLHKVEVSARAI